MEMLFAPQFWAGLGVIIWVNLLLSGDNAVVIALASRSLPPNQQRKAIFWGSAAAIVLRIILTVFAVALLAFPYLKIVGGVLLVWIGYNLLVEGDDEGHVDGHDNLMAAIKTILIADLVMSLDNVLAVAGAAKSAAAGVPGNAELVLLVLGLAISIPIVIFGSSLVLKLMERLPIIITLGAALLGWIAGDMIVTDRAIEGWIDENAMWLKTFYVAKIVGALLVIAIGAALCKRRKPAASVSPQP